MFEDTFNSIKGVHELFFSHRNTDNTDSFKHYLFHFIHYTTGKKSKTKQKVRMPMQSLITVTVGELLRLNQNNFMQEKGSFCFLRTEHNTEDYENNNCSRTLYLLTMLYNEIKLWAVQDVSTF